MLEIKFLLQIRELYKRDIQILLSKLLFFFRTGFDTTRRVVPFQPFKELHVSLSLTITGSAGVIPILQKINFFLGNRTTHCKVENVLKVIKPFCEPSEIIPKKFNRRLPITSNHHFTENMIRVIRIAQDILKTDMTQLETNTMGTPTNQVPKVIEGKVIVCKINRTVRNGDHVHLE